MIIKIKDFKEENVNKHHLFLFYGSNEGLKDETLNNYFLKNYKGSIYRYEEKNILENENNFYENIFTESFFDSEKIIILNRVSDKSEKIIFEILEKNLSSIKIILLAGILDKRSKLRNLFEKDKNIACVPFYEDNNISLARIASDFLRKKKISISNQSINFLVDRLNGDRINLNNELNKIDLFTTNSKKIDLEELKTLTNLSENHSVSELTDNCLAKNVKRLTHILNENNFSSEDCVLILRTILNKSKRNLKIRIQYEKLNDLEKAMSSSRPPIFWKEKEIVKKQISKWPVNQIENFINKINSVEKLVKTNTSNGIYILSDFLINEAIS
tara:strand:+ start:479 stop:1465 length:987 start_codon:yes stop_codon:yes gene_type:complete